jgi:ELWxxDGT repeat protein
MTRVSGAVFFAAGAFADEELWKTRGLGGFRVADIRPGGAGSSPMNLVRVGKRLFFTADDGTHGRELWLWKQ